MGKVVDPEEEKRALKFTGLMLLCVAVGFVTVRLLGARHLDWSERQPLTVWISVWDAALSLVTFGFVIFCLIRFVVHQFSKKREKNLWRRIAYIVGAIACIPVAGIFMSYQVAVIWREGFSPDPLLRTVFVLILFLFSAGWTFIDYILGPINATEAEPTKERHQAGFADFILIVLAIVAGWNVFDSVKRQVDYLLSPPKAVDVRQQKSANVNSPSGGEYMTVEVPNATVLVGVTDVADSAKNSIIGSGVIVKKRIGERVFTLLVTARHVAYAGATLSMKREIFVASPNGLRRFQLNDDPWLIDWQRDDDLAVLDISGLGLEASAIDLDNAGAVKALKSDEFGLCGVRLNAKMFSVCGVPKDRRFEVKSGRYLKEERGFHVLTINAEAGNSGSPVFACENDTIYFVGIMSLKTVISNTEFCGVVPLDNLFNLFDVAREVYFESKDRKGSMMLSSNQDYESILQLMSRKGIATVHRFSTLPSVVLPTMVTVDDVRYDVVRDDVQSRSFSFKDPSGKIVCRGSYIEYPSPFEAMLSAFSYACPMRKRSVEELDRLLKCSWLDQEKTILSLVGVSKTYFLVCDSLVVVIPRSDQLGQTLAIELLRGIAGLVRGASLPSRK